ncbi:uncharacterized protein LTHEOB_1044 [Neofusicoccum parvum]|uniref:Uncharacterized protein LTHEOB_1044 n=1 Tax=Neofusicoccum parvum TaxID=310453 RepID=A0ACB5SPC9_9PEZI|nr:uncharacterized protein LTHEOB_1044 [Neofusicoccum parvum]
MKRLIVGIVSANRPDHEGKVVRYIQDSIGEETFYVGELNLVEKDTGDRGVMLNADDMIEPDEINFRESWDRLKPKVTAMNKKLIALAHAEEEGELSKYELELIDQDPRFLPAAFAACYSAGLVTSSFLRDSGELELVPPFHIGNRGQAKALLARFIRAFPEAEGYLNPLSIARAAGYYLRFQDVLQPKIVNNDREDLTCYDVSQRHTSKEKSLSG